jgi:hypothetical protein
MAGARLTRVLVAVIGCIVGVACRPRPSEEERRGSARIQSAELLAARALRDPEEKTADAVRFAILGSGSVESFHRGYSALFRAHQPVYVTADALLHAWHTSYDDILFTVERHGLEPLLDRILRELRRVLQRSAGPCPGARRRRRLPRGRAQPAARQAGAAGRGG